MTKNTAHYIIINGKKCPQNILRNNLKYFVSFRVYNLKLIRSVDFEIVYFLNFIYYQKYTV